MMLTWKEVIERASHGNPPPDRRVEKTEAEWQASLTPEAYQVTRRSATERPNTSEFCQLFESGQYASYGQHLASRGAAHGSRSEARSSRPAAVGSRP